MPTNIYSIQLSYPYMPCQVSKILFNTLHTMIKYKNRHLDNHIHPHYHPIVPYISKNVSFACIQYPYSWIDIYLYL